MSLLESPYVPALTDFLGTLDESTLQGLAITATGNRLLPTNRKEATELLLRYTNTLPRLFSYKKMTTQVLINYLDKKKVPMRVGMNKMELIDRVQKELEKPVKKKSDRNKALTAGTSAPRAQDSSFRKRVATEPPQATPPSLTANVTLTGNNNAAMNLSVGAAAKNMSLDVCLGGTRNVTTTQPPQPWPSSPTANLHLTTNNAATVSLDVQWRGGGGGEEVSEVFAREFCQWFYTMVNRLQPEASHLQGDLLSMDAFVANSSVDVYLYSGQQVMEKHAVGQKDAFITLRDVLLECGVCFAPHTDRAPWCEMSKFGMMKLQCCGTLHRYQALVGVFEQEFGLVKCPDGKWKVMVLKLNLKKAEPPACPSIQP